MERTLRLIRLCRQGDTHARQVLAEEHTGLVWCVAKRFFHRGVEPEDLFQIGNIGLLKAIDRFDPAFDVRFSTYAVPMIAGEIRRFLRDDSMIKVSRSLKELGVKAARAGEEMQKKLGREATIAELAGELKVEPGELAMAMEAGCAVESLQKPLSISDDQDISLMDRLADGEEKEEMLLNRLALLDVMKKLEPREQKLIRMRYFSEYTQAKAGEALGISQVQVSRLEKKILRKMRDLLEGKEKDT